MKKLTVFIFSFASILFLECNNDDYTPTDKGSGMSADSAKAGISEKPFGEFEHQPVTEYIIHNATGMSAGILNYGGILASLVVPDKNGNGGDVVLGFDSMEGYLQKNDPYFGALVGRYANRISHAKFILDGKTFQLAANDHGNSLHGGNRGFDKVMWTAEKLGDSSLKLTYLSKDGEEGYPGNLAAQVIYTLGADNSLKLEYRATTDRPTPVNLTNHSYFNLSAGKDSTILHHILQLNADKYTPVNESLIPTGKIESVRGTPMDFTSAKMIGKDIQAVKGGYDHNWIINRKTAGMEKAASLYEPNSGRYMEVFTTQPGIQFYTGNFLDGTLQYTKAEQKYGQHGALCLETQHYPDSPNEPLFPNTILRPGDTLSETTVYKFSVK